MAVKDADDSIPAELSISLDIRSFFVDMAIDLKLIAAFAIATVALIYVPYLNETFIRSAFGLVMVLFVPGYSLIAALFPKKKDIDGIERAALSFGLSIAVTPLIGLGLNYTPWGIRLDPIVVCLTIFTIICVLVANKRRHSIGMEDRFHIDFAKVFEDARKEAFPESEGRLDKILTVILILSIIASILVLAYVVVVPKQGEKFTEFYILGPNGKAENYPTMFALGDQQPVIVGVVNHEYRNVTYDLVVVLNDSKIVTQIYTDRLTLADNQTWEKTVQLKPDRTGDKMKLEFDLYADGNMTAPYREVHLWVDVT
ncbi:DUF1616 domain-containing protein [Methanocella sp. MCL-LM]|uniref:DUF1616 domain-containing protein n=1 Tax=Methanocella sp. MCL-LM TaxID=3412035 RepID=UPI003C751893